MPETFETLATSGIIDWFELPKDADESFEHWLLAEYLSEPWMLWDETNLAGLHDRLRQRYGEEAARLIWSDGGCAVALVLNPDHPEAVAEAHRCLAEIGRGVHIDEALYNEAIAEHCQEIWECAELAERIDFAEALEPEEIVLALEDACPPGLHGHLAERYEL